MAESDALIGGILVAFGLLALFLPLRWNPFRVKPLFEPLVPEKARPIVPRVLGVLFLAIGIIVIAGAML